MLSCSQIICINYRPAAEDDDKSGQFYLVIRLAMADDLNNIIFLLRLSTWWHSLPSCPRFKFLWSYILGEVEFYPICVRDTVDLSFNCHGYTN
jgi:hypothetical protein